MEDFNLDDLETKGFQLAITGEKLILFINPLKQMICVFERENQKRGLILKDVPGMKFLASINVLIDIGFSKEEAIDLYGKKVIKWVEDEKAGRPCQCPNCVERRGRETQIPKVVPIKKNIMDKFS